LRLGLLITAQGGAHGGELSGAQGQDAGFAPPLKDRAAVAWG